MGSYCYLGNGRYLAAVKERLDDAGFVKIEDTAEADWVITFFTSLTAQEDAFFGDDGLVERMKKGAIVVDLSASTPNLSTEICSVATVSDIVMVASPICIKNKLAEDVFSKVNSYCYAGSEDDGVERAMELLDVLFGDIRPVADAGVAQLLRTARTIQNTSEMVSAIEALSLFEACGASAATTFDIASLVPHATSPEAYFILEAVKEKRFNGDYTVEMLLSEISAAMMTADDYEMILPQMEAAFHLYELLAIIGGADLSPAALALVYEGDRAPIDGEDRTETYGLDWSRVEQLYGSSDDELEEDAEDGLTELFGQDLGFSSN